MKVELIEQLEKILNKTDELKELIEDLHKPFAGYIKEKDKCSQK